MSKKKNCINFFDMKYLNKNLHCVAGIFFLKTTHFLRKIFKNKSMQNHLIFHFLPKRKRQALLLITFNKCMF